jgi:flagellar motor component MotA
MRTLSTVAGLFLFLLGLIGSFVIAGGSIFLLLQMSAIFALIFAPLGAVIMAYGFERVLRTIGAVRFLFRDTFSGKSASDCIPVLKTWIRAVYATSFVFFVMAIMIILAHTDASMEELCWHFCGSLVVFIIAFLFCEGILRPLKNRLKVVCYTPKQPIRPVIQ